MAVRFVLDPMFECCCCPFEDSCVGFRERFGEKRFSRFEIVSNHIGRLRFRVVGSQFALEARPDVQSSQDDLRAVTMKSVPDFARTNEFYGIMSRSMRVLKALSSTH